MAIIELDSGETFEHIHRTQSTTSCISGRVDFGIGGNWRPLQLGETIEVPANTPHAR